MGFGVKERLEFDDGVLAFPHLAVSAWCIFNGEHLLCEKCRVVDNVRGKCIVYADLGRFHSVPCFTEPAIVVFRTPLAARMMNLANWKKDGADTCRRPAADHYARCVSNEDEVDWGQTYGVRRARSRTKQGKGQD